MGSIPSVWRGLVGYGDCSLCTCEHGRGSLRKSACVCVPQSPYACAAHEHGKLVDGPKVLLTQKNRNQYASS